MIDSHVHLDDPRFDEDRDAVLARARHAGVDAFVVPGTTTASWPKIAALAATDDGIHPAYGLHPWFMDRHGAGDLEALDAWLGDHPAVALGECGLDFLRGDEDRDAQLELFRGQLELARRHDLPLIVHALKSVDAVLRELRRRPGLRGVLHSFSGSLQQAEQAWRLGFRIGIVATVGFERARRLRSVVAAMPLEALLIETDAPDQPGPQRRGERNEPAWLPEHLAVMAELRGETVDDLARHLDDNARNLFSLEKHP